MLNPGVAAVAAVEAAEEDLNVVVEVVGEVCIPFGTAKLCLLSFIPVQLLLLECPNIFSRDAFWQ